MGDDLRLVSYDRGFAVAAALLVLVVALGLWARESMTKTRVNRVVYASVVFVPVGQLIMFAGMYTADIPPRTALLAMMMLWFTVAAMFVIGVDRRLWPCAVGYMLGFLAAARWPGHQLYFMAAANLVFCLTAVWTWRPPRGAIFRRAPEERAGRE